MCVAHWLYLLVSNLLGKVFGRELYGRTAISGAWIIAKLNFNFAELVSKGVEWMKL
jgi:hypothetical protein